MEVYKGFAIEEQEGKFKAYRSEHYMEDRIASYEASSLAELKSIIDSHDDHGKFSGMLSSVTPVESWEGIQIGHELAKKTLKGRGVDLSIKGEACGEVMDFWDSAAKYALSAGELYAAGKKEKAIGLCDKYYGASNVANQRRLAEVKLELYASEAGIVSRHEFVMQFIPDAEIQTLAELFIEFVSLMAANTDVTTVLSYASEIDGFCVVKSYSTYHQCMLMLGGS